jgi:hypothetical protein
MQSGDKYRCRIDRGKIKNQPSQGIQERYKVVPFTVSDSLSVTFFGKQYSKVEQIDELKQDEPK